MGALDFINDVCANIMEKIASTAMERYILNGGKAAKEVYDKAWKPYWVGRVNNVGGRDAMVSKMMTGADNHLKSQQRKGFIRNIIEDMPNAPQIPAEDINAAMQKAQDIMPDFVELANLKSKAKFTGDPRDHAEYVKRIMPYKDQSIAAAKDSVKYFTDEGRKKYNTGPKAQMGQTVPNIDADGKITSFDVYTSGGRDEYPESNLITKNHEAQEVNLMKKYIGKPWADSMFDLQELNPNTLSTHAGIAPMESDRKTLLRLPPGYADLYNARYGDKPGQMKFDSVDDINRLVQSSHEDQLKGIMQREHAEYKNRTGHDVINWR